MIVSEIRYDRVTIYKPIGENSIYKGCLVALKEDNSVRIDVTGDVSSSWVHGSGVVMNGYRFVELTPWSLIFDSNMVEGKRILDVRVVCEFNMFDSESVRADLAKDIRSIRFSGNRKCEVCGNVRGLSSFHNHDECDVCTDKALQAYYAVGEKLEEDGVVNEYLMPSKRVYMRDYLTRMKDRREREEEETVDGKGGVR